MPPHGDPHHPGDAPAAAPADGAAAVDALAVMLPLVHTELRAAAARLLWREGPGHTLQPTELVHEAWLRLAGQAPSRIEGRQHFVGIAARLMRQVLVDHARRRLALKRGGGVRAVTLEQAGAAATLAPEDLLVLDEALERLGQHSPRLRQVVEYRFFAGLEEEEIAEVLGVTTRTVQRDWVRARAWLHQALAPEGAAGGG